MNRTDLQLLADARVADAEILISAGRWAAAYYLLGYAVECGLKACAARQFQQDEVPDRAVVNDFYTHSLDKLLGISGVKAALEERARVEPDFQVNWNTVRDWKESSRTIIQRQKRRRAICWLQSSTRRTGSCRG
jgi:hypothetical protein